MSAHVHDLYSMNTVCSCGLRVKDLAERVEKLEGIIERIMLEYWPRLPGCGIRPCLPCAEREAFETEIRAALAEKNG